MPAAGEKQTEVNRETIRRSRRHMDCHPCSAQSTTSAMPISAGPT
jgi:hypothetical protein